MTTLHIPYTLEISALIGNTNGVRQFAFCGCEFDAELVVEYTSPEDWEITGLLFTQTRWNPEFEVTGESDPDLWRVIVRGIDLDDKAISSLVVEQIHEDIAARRDDYADYLLEQRRDAQWEAGR